jgi:DNA-directed RNA polymerase subunit RPC12/RpoP
MSGVRTFFRHCPSCGRRFEIQLVNKEMVDSQELTEDTKREKLAPSYVGAFGRTSPPTNVVRNMPAIVSVDAPSIVDIEDFQYTYRCKHCGHEWSEVHETKSSFYVPKGYTGD